MANGDDADKLPPIPQKMLDLLSDGKEHGIEELVALLNDDLADNTNVQPHLSVVRRYVELRDQRVHCEGPRGGRAGATGKTRYRLINLPSKSAVGIRK